MRRANDLEQRLIEWGREYGHGRSISDWGSRSTIYTMMIYHGPAPQGLNPRSRTDRTPADEVQAAVDDLIKKHHGWENAQVLLCEYSSLRHPVEMRLQYLRDIGIVLQRSAYYRKLRVAREFVADAIGLPIDVEDAA